LLRRAVREGTELGRKAKDFMDRGELVPDSLLLDLVRETLQSRPAPPGWILDGYPRNRSQAESLTRMLEEIGIGLGGVLNLRVNPEVLVDRLRKRAALENRVDDTEETVKNRLRVYEDQTAPLVDFYRGRGVLREVDGVGSVDEVQLRVSAAVHGSFGAVGPSGVSGEPPGGPSSGPGREM
jgi:adenylate kinase